MAVRLLVYALRPRSATDRLSKAIAVDRVDDAAVASSDEGGKEGLIQLQKPKDEARQTDQQEQEPAHEPVDELERDEARDFGQRLDAIDVREDVREAQARRDEPDDDEKDPALDVHPRLEKLGSVQHGVSP